MEREIAGLVEEFKIPFRDPYCPTDWKDWYHYVLYDPKTTIRILYNICFNGVPEKGYITDTFVINTPKGFIGNELSGFGEEESFGFARTHSWQTGELDTSPLTLHNEHIDLLINSRNVLHLRTSHPELSIEFYFQGRSECSPIYVPELAPYGKGFIGWGAMPDYKMSGELIIHDRKISITEDWKCYHDKNFGRFNWGNIGWTWFVVKVWDHEGNPWTYVLHRSNTPDYRAIGAPILFVHKCSKLHKVFLGDTVSIHITWSEGHDKQKMLPGSMASIFDDRSIRIPTSLVMIARDEKAKVTVEMSVNDHTEIIVPDSESKAYTYMKELTGSVSVTQDFSGQESASKAGFFYAEVVH